MTDYIHYGEVTRRIAAGAIDLAILALPAGAFALLSPGEPEEATASLIVFASGLVMFYKMILEGSPWQATIGKRLLDLKVTNPEGDQLSWANTAVRSWPFWLPGALFGLTGQLIPVVIIICGAALVLVPFTPRRQGLHDFTARSIVVRRHVEFRPPEEGAPYT